MQILGVTVSLATLSPSPFKYASAAMIWICVLVEKSYMDVPTKQPPVAITFRAPYVPSTEKNMMSSSRPMLRVAWIAASVAKSN